MRSTLNCDQSFIDSQFSIQGHTVFPPVILKQPKQHMQWNDDIFDGIMGEMLMRATVHDMLTLTQAWVWSRLIWVTLVFSLHSNRECESLEMNKLRQSLRRKKPTYVPEASRPHQWQADEEAVRKGKCSFAVRVGNWTYFIVIRDKTHWCYFLSREDR